MNGIEILKIMREKQKNTQIIMLTSNDRQKDIVDALNL
jgi:DNA-binding response OmpR family regulator